MSKPKPTTPEDWLHLTNLYEKAMLKDKQTIASLKEELNKMKQRLKSSHQVSRKSIKSMRR